MRQFFPRPAQAAGPFGGIRDIAPESVLVLAGGRAILLQLADPAVGHGVARHSDFTSRPLDRLHGTLSYVYAVTCGTPADRAALVHRVSRAHRPVHGPARPSTPDSPAAPRYNAFDPQLQLWVAATLYESATRMHDLIFGPLTGPDADALYRDYAVLGTALQLPPGHWPADRAAFSRYWEERLRSLSTDATTRGVADQLLRPRTGPIGLRLLMPLARLITIGLLEPRERDLFGLDWSPARQVRFDRVLAVLRLVYPRLPRMLRHAPMRHYLRAGRADARRRRAAGADAKAPATV